jgi:hypothetical protein
MCTPQLAIGIQAAGGVASASGQQAATGQQADYYNYLGDLDRYEAKIVEARAERESGYIIDKAAKDTAAVSTLEAAVLGSQQATSAAAGVGSGSVTSEDLARDAINQADLDKAAIRYNADVGVFETQTTAKGTAASLRARAKSFGTAAKSARSAGRFNFFTSILGTAESVSSQYSNLKYSGAIS